MSLYVAIDAWEDRAEGSKPEDLPNLKIGNAFEEKASGERWHAAPFSLSRFLPVMFYRY